MRSERAFGLVVSVLCFWAISICAAQFRVPLIVKETAGGGVDRFPVAAVVPLSRGAFKETSGFVLADERGRRVDAQFVPLTRWWAFDGSIRQLKVEFLAGLEAYRGGETGIAKFFLTSGSGAASTQSPLEVKETESGVTVVTGPLKFTVRRKPFKLFESLRLDINGDGLFQESEELLRADSPCGSILVGRTPKDVQCSWERRDVSLVVEEKGPLSVTVKAWSPTLIKESGTHRHGFAIRLTAWAGLPWIKIDYQLQNSALNVPRGAPLYFDSLELRFPLRFTEEPVATVLLSEGKILKRKREAGLRLAQEFHDRAGLIYLSPELEIADAGALSTGALDLSTARWGVSAFVRYFWQLWPNGIVGDEKDDLRIELFPAWSAQWFVLREPKGFSPSASSNNYLPVLAFRQNRTRGAWRDLLARCL